MPLGGMRDGLRRSWVLRGVVPADRGRWSGDGVIMVDDVISTVFGRMENKLHMA